MPAASAVAPAAEAAIPLDSVRTVPTPEHIAFEFRLAGPMARGMAWALDVLIKIAALIALGMALLLTGTKAAIGFWLVMWFLMDWFAGAICEWLWQGRTPGKRALGIRVVGIDGLPAGPGSCFLRNVLRTADWLPLGFAVGLIAMFLSGTFRRLGDLAAGTVVIYDRGRPPESVLRIDDEGARQLAARLPPETVSVVDGRAARAIATHVARRRQFHPRRRTEMAEHLAGPLRQRFGLARRIDADQLLCACYLRLFGARDGDRRGPGARVRAADGAEDARGRARPAEESPVQPPAPAASGAGTRAAAFLASRRGDWKRLERLVAVDAATGGDGTTRAGDLSRLYRSACADLALADAYHLPAGTVDYLHEAVGRAHLRFYRRIAISWRAISHLVFVRVPGELYGDPCLRVALLSFYGVFLLSGLLGAFRPDLAEAFAGSEAIEQMRDMYSDPHGDRSAGDGAAMGGFYIHNNVGIALSTFAYGLFAGVGSLVGLVYNGLFLGLIFGSMAMVEEPIRGHFFEFVTAHGPFELTGITLAGAAGLRMGLGLLAHGGLPRLESLRRSAQQAVPMICVAAILVALAAPIEGFISPSGLPVAAKRALAVVCTLLILVYLIVLGRRGRRIIAGGESAPAPAMARGAA